MFQEEERTCIKVFGRKTLIFKKLKQGPCGSSREANQEYLVEVKSENMIDGLGW